jgi:hypothetical protein
MFFYEVIDSFEKEKLKYAIVGGYALALHGIVRATMDIDLVLSLNQDNYERAEKCLLGLNLQSRIPVRAQDIIKMRKEYIEKRNLIAWSFVDFKNPTRQLDIIITIDFNDINTERISVGGKKLNVISLEDLLKMKKAAGRPQDLIDVESIKKKLNEKKQK